MDSVQEFSEALGKTIAFSPSFNAILTVVGWLESIIPGLKKSGNSTFSNKTMKNNQINETIYQ